MTSELQSFRDMILEAGEVEKAGLDGRIARAEAVAFLRLGKTAIGIGALKRPDREYIRNVFTRANSKYDIQALEFELGWVVVEKAHRGYFFSRRIVEVLVKRRPSSRLRHFCKHQDCYAQGADRVWLPAPWRPDEKLFLFVCRASLRDV